MGMYESPIRIIESAIDSFQKSLIKEKEDAIILEVQRSLGVDVDRGGLLRALQYDRFLYDKGYSDGKRDAEAALVRCKECKEWGGVVYGGRCKRWSAPLAGMTLYTNADDFCSYGERKDNGTV